jgi:poly(3-hydroxybutyrate) depolymerase
LHSANRTAYDYLGFAFLNRRTEDNDPATAMTNVPDGLYGLYLNSRNAEWWGWSQARQNISKHVNAPAPAELRVLDTIEWVVSHYKIDRNRIYLAGVSMGGNGTPAIGMSHDNVFAAIRATVPAGTGYASYLRGGFAPSPDFNASQAERSAWLLRASGTGLPDPPVIVDFSSPLDGWSVTQPALVQAAEAGHLPLVLGWVCLVTQPSDR